MAGEGAIDADATAGDSAEERVERNRLVGPEELYGPLTAQCNSHCQCS